MQEPDAKLTTAQEDAAWNAWLNKQWSTQCQRERRWKPSTEQAHAMYEYQKARRYKRLISESAAYEYQLEDFRKAVSEATDILGAALAGNALPASIYEAVTGILNEAVKGVQVK